MVFCAEETNYEIVMPTRVSAVCKARGDSTVALQDNLQARRVVSKYRGIVIPETSRHLHRPASLDFLRPGHKSSIGFRAKRLTVVLTNL